MIIQTTNLPPNQAIQPDMRAHGTVPARSTAPNTDAPSVPAPAQVPAETLDNAVVTLNQAMQQSNQALEFSVDTEANRTVVRMVDTSTGELIRQFPSEAALAISRDIAELQQGLLLKQKA